MTKEEWDELVAILDGSGGKIRLVADDELPWVEGENFLIAPERFLKMYKSGLLEI